MCIVHDSIHHDLRWLFPISDKDIRRLSGLLGTTGRSWRRMVAIIVMLIIQKKISIDMPLDSLDSKRRHEMARRIEYLFIWSEGSTSFLNYTIDYEEFAEVYFFTTTECPEIYILQ